MGEEDKEGVLIFEGDIVDIDDGEGWVVGKEVVKKGFNYDSRIIKIIGNIHENPKLLKDN